MTPDSAEAKFIMMTETPVERLVCRMAGPTIIIMLISSLYNMADTYFVGSLGTSATGGVGVVFSLMAVIQATGFFFGQGAGSYIARALGSHHMERASGMAATGVISALLCGGTITLLGLTWLKPLARFLGATDTILPYACDYLFYILIGAPWMTTSLALNNLLRFQGSAFYSMIGMVSGALLNVILDPLFIFVFHMGVSGASLATMLSQFLSFSLLLAGCARSGNVRIDPRQFTPRLSVYREILRGGAPSMCRQIISSVGTLCINRVAGGYGDAAIAAMSIVQRVMMFANSAMLGFGQGFQPVCGFNYGAGRYDRVLRAFWFFMRVAFLILLVAGMTGFIFAPQIIALFRKDDPAVIAVGTTALRFQCATFATMSWITPANMMLQVIGKSLRATSLALARQGLFLIPILFILTHFFGVRGLQMSQSVADIATVILSASLATGVLREMASGRGKPEDVVSPENLPEE
ncbi:MAG: MATE family efflux transporter [Synergistaceae bacterium]|jgi:putative MATE family efflux protein|nr:MATE family efflux transporter [Synergistaceae bacterium]